MSHNLWYNYRGQVRTAKEIDISFGVGSMLFICELKCIARSWAYERGETEALKYRQGKLENALNECEGKVEWLVQHPIGQNYAVPHEITHVIPVVISPFVEYIWSRSSRYWLTTAIPRVCTPDELVSVKEENLGHLVGAEYTRHIPR